MLQAAYFSHFKGHSDILQFWGNDAELCELRDALAELSSGGRGRHFAGRNCGIDLRLAATSAGARRQGDRLLEWAIDRKDAADFRDRVAALIASGRSGHQYLSDTTAGGITVMVSRAEYPPDIKAEPLPELHGSSALAAAGWTFLAIAAAAQVVAIANAWHRFDDRLSCDRLHDWGEWLSCLHGVSHEHIIMIEIAVGSWAAAGLTLLLGRALPSFVSAIVPIIVTAVFVVGAVNYWDEGVIPYAAFDDLTLEESVRRQIIFFAITETLLFACMVLPAVGAWLFGRHARRMRTARA